MKTGLAEERYQAIDFTEDSARMWAAAGQAVVFRQAMLALQVDGRQAKLWRRRLRYARYMANLSRSMLDEAHKWNLALGVHALGERIEEEASIKKFTGEQRARRRTYRPTAKLIAAKRP